MNGCSDYEIGVRDDIADMIKSGDNAQARKTSQRFLRTKNMKAKTRRLMLLRTVKGWVELVNEKKGK